METTRSAPSEAHPKTTALNRRESKAARKSAARKERGNNRPTKQGKRKKGAKNQVSTLPEDMPVRPGGKGSQARGKWTPEEHERFLRALREHGNKWSLVAEAVQTRSRPQIRSHCQKYFEGIKRRALEQLKATNQLQGKLFLITREYINTNSILLRRPYEIELEPGQCVRSRPRPSPSSPQEQPKPPVPHPPLAIPVPAQEVPAPMCNFRSQEEVQSKADPPKAPHDRALEAIVEPSVGPALAQELTMGGEMGHGSCMVILPGSPCHRTENEGYLSQVKYDE